MKTISILTPCYNEEGNVQEMYEAVKKVMSSMPQYTYEHLFIDNLSIDNTANILREIAKSDKHVKVILNERNFGPGRSGSYGFFQTSGDATICLACDFQDPPEMIPEYIKLWERGHKVIWGKKTSSNEKGLMFAVRTLYYSIIQKFSDVKQYKHVTGFGLYDKSVVIALRELNEPNPNFRNLIAELGYEIAFVEYVQAERRRGKSSYNFFRYFDTAVKSLVNTSQVPLRMMTFIGFFLSGLSFLIGCIYLILKLIYWNSFNMGTAPVLIGIFFLGAVQIFFIGVIGEYIGEILTRVTKRPLVIVKERINFEESIDEE
jgi:polyisoprenyl-phosphate glycosyltransferase